MGAEFIWCAFRQFWLWKHKVRVRGNVATVAMLRFEEIKLATLADRVHFIK